MTEPVNLPLDSETAERLQMLGRDLLRDQSLRDSFLRDRTSVMNQYGLQSVDLGNLDERVLGMLADPEFERVVQQRDIPGIREFVQARLGDRLPEVAGSFDFDFDFEFEVEVIAVAVAVFDFAVAKTKVPDPAEVTRRRAIVADALRSVARGGEGRTTE
jgi:hypothetical protein